MKLKSVCALIAAMSVGSVLAANTWYVDDDNYGGAVRDGSPENPYGTIQEAIDADATQTGDTIKVRPGVYSNDVVSAGNGVPYPSRVFVRKNVRIISTDGKDATVIEGVRDPGDAHGMGDASVACVFFDSNAADMTSDDVVFDGFTLRNGTVNDASSGFGGGIAQSAYYPSRTSYHVIDCVISNCASRTAVNRCVSLHRCVVTRNYTKGTYTGLGYGFAENTLFFVNVAGSGDCVGSSSLVNCTFAGHSGGKISYGATCILNSIIALNSSDRCNENYQYLTNSVVSTFDLGDPATRFPNAYNSAVGVASTNTYHAPIFGDFRPIATSPAVGRADARMLTLIPLPSGYGYRDLAGNEIDVTSATPIQAGAYQEAVDISTECCVQLTTQNDKTDLINVSLNGFAVPHANILFAYMPAYPGLVSFGSVGTSSPLSNVQNPFAEKDFRFVGYDGLCWLPRPKPGESASYPVSCATRFYYADPRGSDSWDGSCDFASRDEAARKGPWKTLIHAATNSVVNNDRRSMISCAAGVYDEGQYVSDRYRVFVPGNSGRRLHFVSADGRGKAVIVGASDPGTEDGNGPKAISCIRADPAKKEYGIGFVGFALTGGHSPAASSTWGADFGAICRNGGNGGLTIADSIITNNVGAQLLIHQARIERCLVANNVSTYKSTFGLSNFAGCILRDNDAPEATGWITDASVLVNCHLAQTTTAGVKGYVVNSGSAYVYNSVFTDCTSCHKVTECRGCVLENSAGNRTNFSDYFQGDARLAHTAVGDYRPLPDSQVWTQAVPDLDAVFKHGSTDYDGTPIFDGSRLRGAGAILTPATGVVSVDDTARLTVTGLTPGSHVLEKGATLSIAPNADSTRPVVGWSVGGTNGFFNADASKSFTLDDVTAAGGYLKIEPVLGTEWFANANTDPSAGIVGSDDNHGFSRYFPKKTLAEALKNAASNDTVWAAAGRYDEKTMNTQGYSQPARAEVPAWVSLRSEDDDPATTFIMGQAGSEENGTGADAVRCVVLMKGALVRGFTCTGGRMRDNTKDTSASRSAPGICCSSYPARETLAENCVVSNCIAQDYIILGGTYRNCRVLENTTFDRGLGYNLKLVNCLIAGNRLPSPRQAFMYSQFENVSFLPDNVYSDKDGRFVNSFCYDDPASNCSVINSFISTKCDEGNSCTNCVFYGGVVRSSFVNPIYVSKEADLKLDGWVPQLDSPLTDAGTNACACVADPGTYAVDCRGCPRVMNGTIDIGAVEADWRPRYSADIRRSRVDVVSVTPSVVETAEKNVALGTDGKGGALTLDCLRPSGQKDAEMTFDVRVTGTGTLTVTPEGGEAQVFTFSPEKQVCKLAGDVSRATFAYAPGTGDAGTAEILGAHLISGALLLIR